MCGITGAVWTDPQKSISAEVLRQMTEILRHRGPDDDGYWGPSEIEQVNHQGASTGVALGFRRLAIIDLAGSRQPIANEDGTIQAVFNGEIFNYRELREELIGKGHRFRTEGDSETIVHLYEELGPRCFERFNGFFAIAIWDARQEKLVLGRDRLGQKPLVYRQEPGRLLFASELKSLLEVPGLPRTVNRRAVDDYLVYQYVPFPHTILEGYSKLPPGHRAVWERGRFQVEPYWSPDLDEDPGIPLDEAAEQLRELFDSSIRLRLQSDVPLGAFLSGGIDSSLVVESMVRQSGQRIKTFSIGFPIREYDESGYAEQVAQFLGTEHHRFLVTPDADSILDDLVFLYDEPFADSSAIPTWYVSRLTREHVTVALSGDGGDELFAGYDRYRAVQLAERLDRLGPFRRLLGARFWQGIPSSSKQKSIIRQLKRFSYALSLSPLRRYLDWISIFNDERRRDLYEQQQAEALGDSDPIWFLRQFFDELKHRDTVTAISLTDLRTYLPCDLNTKVDLASMGNSLEVRQPFLDYRLVEFAMRLPLDFKLRGGRGKYLLRKAFRDRLPRTIWDRRKMGFGVPIAEWFRGELKSRLADTILRPDAACLEFLSGSAIARLFTEHQDRTVDHGYRLWAILMLELWLQRWVHR